MTAPQAHTGPDKGNEDARKLRISQRLSERLNIRNAYGVPVVVLTTSQFPSLKRPGGRVADRKDKKETAQQRMAGLDLQRDEQRILEQAAELVYDSSMRSQMEKDGQPAPEDGQELMKEYAVARIYDRLQKMLETGNEGEFVNFWRWHHKGKREAAHKAGPEKYEELEYGIVLLNTSHNDVNEALAHMLHTFPGQIGETGLGMHDLYLSVLEHELAHAAGAGESQADAMAAAQIMRMTGDKVLPQALADIRALMCIRDYLVFEARREAEDLMPGGRPANPRAKAMTKHREKIARYGWAPVEALDEQLASPDNEPKPWSTEAGVKELRWKSHTAHHRLLMRVADMCLDTGLDEENRPDGARLRRNALLHGRVNYRRLDRRLKKIQQGGDFGLRRYFNRLSVQDSQEMMRLVTRMRSAIGNLIAPSPDMKPDPRNDNDDKNSPKPGKPSWGQQIRMFTKFIP